MFQPEISQIGTQKYEMIWTLLDSGSMLNLISELKVVELGWVPLGTAPPQAATISGHTLLVYSTYAMEVKLKDSMGKIRTLQQAFY